MNRNAIAGIVTVLACIVTGAPMPAKAAPQPLSWEKIAEFYAGKPVTFDWDARREAGGATFGDGRITLAATFQERLAALADALRSGNRKRIEQQAVLGVDPLAVLLHEAIHNRDGMEAGFGRSKRDEKQAAALGAELIPDVLNRFFGIPLDSPLSRMFARNAKSRGEYEGAYR